MPVAGNNKAESLNVKPDPGGLCIEKLIKALLLTHPKSPERTHNLIFLSQSLHQVHSDWDPDLKDLRLLNHAAIAFRYPGETADPEDAQEAFATAQRLRNQLLSLLAK